MIYKTKVGDIDLSKVTRLYPAAVVEMYGERAEMSLEWIDMNADKVKVHSFVLVFDCTPVGDDLKNRTVLEFATKEELIKSMNEVAQLFHD